jgi:hypothetical protein
MGNIGHSMALVFDMKFAGDFHPVDTKKHCIVFQWSDYGRMTNCTQGDIEMTD